MGEHRGGRGGGRGLDAVHYAARIIPQQTETNWPTRGHRGWPREGSGGGGGGVGGD